MDGAGAALADAATIFGTAQFENVAQRPEQGHIGRCVHRTGMSVHVEFKGHSFLQTFLRYTSGSPHVQSRNGRKQAGILAEGRRFEMEIGRAGSQPSNKGSADYFTGAVRIDPLFRSAAPARVVGASVTFEPGARTAWHSHPLGQALVVTAGCGRAQRWGGAIEEIRPGDVISFAPGEKHWHGAGPATAMTHLAIQEALEGKTADWMEHVTDEQYEA